MVFAAILVFTGVRLPGAWRGYRGEGSLGTTIVTSQDCGRGGCSYNGDFVGRDGRRRVHHVLLQGGTHAVGDRVSTVLSSSDEVFIKGDSSTLVIEGFAAFVAAACLLGWTVWMTDRWRSRGRSRRHPELADAPAPL